MNPKCPYCEGEGTFKKSWTMKGNVGYLRKTQRKLNVNSEGKYNVVEVQLFRCNNCKRHYRKGIRKS